ncbi:sensor histidine kinase [Bacteroidota bacterium]
MKDNTRKFFFHKPFIVRMLVVVGFWAFLSILISSANYFEWRERADITWLRVLIIDGKQWFIWIILSPGILWLSNKYPFKQGSWKRPLRIHIISCLITCVIYAILILVITMIFSLHDRTFMEFFESRWKFLLIEIYIPLLIYWVILGVGHAINHYAVLKERELKSAKLEKSLVVSQLQALKNQLKPHFLFNTMHSISNLIRKKSYNQAIDMIAGFGELLRSSLSDSDSQLISIKRELYIINLYLDIEKIRFKNRLSCTTDISDNVLHCLIPSFLLQQLVENSVKHGINKFKDSIAIHISAKKFRDNITLGVSDNGPGLSDDWSIEKADGLGLKNIKKRLSILYGNKYEFELNNKKESGLNILISIPILSDIIKDE